MKPLSFKLWLMAMYAIDYDRWKDDLPEQTKKVWTDGYEVYLREWEVKMR